MLWSQKARGKGILTAACDRSAMHAVMFVSWSLNSEIRLKSDQRLSPELNGRDLIQCVNGVTVL
jgi:hypothetical protein